MDSAIVTKIFLFALLISSTRALDPCACQADGSDLSIVPIYSKCSPFNPPKQDSLLNTVLNMASKDPQRLKYLSSLAAQMTTSVPIAPGKQVLNIGNYVVRVKLGSLKLGPAGQPKNIRTTPLLRNPHRPSLYYVNLTGVSVGQIRLPIASELLTFDPNTGAGTIIDSGTVITRFIEPIYTAIRDEFRKQVQGPFSSIGAFDTCFAATNEAVAPAITLHLTGLNLVLPMENSLIHSSAGSLACLAMAAAPNNVNSVLNVIANLQQQNLRILFDAPNSRLGIARELCN
ncbi:hypothetical protein GH714_026324 [Hevea brasiliensis]|uniref:Peptidase A1 domain-containing protein n=1 Tax=Hevea brasiliensis TaxID=3981 RepID=A0A6A6LCJ7_HEVBR|nr:hypothetical protein GH714_026324 [Hevea brasiliensis]